MTKNTFIDSNFPKYGTIMFLWLTLFWIPVIPLGTKYYVSCPIKNYGAKMKKEEVLGMMQEIVE